LTDLFPKPWYSEWVYDAYRIYDANGRQLFVISSDEYTDSETDEEHATVMEFGSKEERHALNDAIEEIFPEKDEYDGTQDSTDK
jgi:hypothetical protein